MTTIYVVLRHAYDSDTELYSVDISTYTNAHDAETHIAKCTDSRDVYEIKSAVISETARSRRESRQDDTGRVQTATPTD